MTSDAVNEPRATEAEVTSRDGDVTPGGPPAVHSLPGLTIRKLAVSSMSNNAYLVTCAATGAQLLIDAADDAAALIRLIEQGRADHEEQYGPTSEPLLGHLVTTHQHWDHHRALGQVVAETHPRTYAGAPDADALPVLPDVRLEHGDTITVGAMTLDVIRLTGHTPGSVALAVRENAADERGDGETDTGAGHAGHDSATHDTGAHARVHLFTGDALFPGGIGNTKNPGQSFEQLYADVVARVFEVYGDDTRVYPGHGADTTLGVERPHLAEWCERGW